MRISDWSSDVGSSDLEAGVVVHVDCRHAQQLKPAFGACCLTRPEIADAGCFLTRFGDETGIQGDDVMTAAVLPDQSAVEAHEIKWFFELDTVALFAIFAVPFQLLEIDPALYRTRSAERRVGKGVVGSGKS